MSPYTTAEHILQGNRVLSRLNAIDEFAKKASKDSALQLQFQAKFEIASELYNKFNDNSFGLKIDEEKDRKTFDGLVEKIDDVYGNIKCFQIQLKDILKCSDANKTNVRLPKIDIPKFDENFKNSSSFFDLFKSLIDDNKTLSDVEKFQYLLTSLVGEPLNLVKTLPLSEANYKIAFKTLSDRYYNLRFLASNYWKGIFGAPTAVESNAKSLRNLLNVITENLSALELMENLDLWDFTLFNIVFGKLDFATQNEFEIQHKTLTIPSFKDLNTFLNNRCLALETVKCLSSENKYKVDLNRKLYDTKKVASQSYSNSKQTSSFVSNTSTNNCCFCKSISHTLLKCDKFLELEPYSRYLFAKENRLCFRCLDNSRHGVKRCYSSSSCGVCKLGHHTLLHFAERNQPVKKNSEIVNPDSIPLTALSQPSTSEAGILKENKTVGSFSSTVHKNRGLVLLSTAMVAVRDSQGIYRDCRVLLDTASQASFISDKCLEMLGLEKKPLSMSIQGLNQVKTASSQGVTNYLIKPRFSGEPVIEVELIVLSRICSAMPPEKVEIRRSWKHIRDLSLADENFGHPQEIDILLGEIVPLIFKPCPEKRNFREDQCSALNGIPYEGSSFEWFAHYDDDHPCALTCKGKPLYNEEASTQDPVLIVVRLADKVHDGTRCRPGSLDMCIDGICQRVGCDLNIGSNKQVDTCGICGGDGSSCARPLYHWTLTSMSLCSTTCGGGYKMSRPLCQNRVSGEEVEEQLCNASQKPDSTVVQCNIHNCPPKSCFTAVEGRTKTSSRICQSSITDCRAELFHFRVGNLSRPFWLICILDKQYQQWAIAAIQNNIYSVSTWHTSEWSQCSVSCGGGSRVRHVNCAEETNNTKLRVNEDKCGGIKPYVQESCNEFDCPAWHSAVWSGCSVSCGEGIQSRSVYCRDSTNSPSLLCPSHTKPKTTQLCSTGIQCPYHFESTEEILPGLYHTQPLVQPYPPPPPAHAERLVGEQVIPSESTFIPDEWSPCSVTCGEGLRKREVHCKIFLEFSRTIAKLPDKQCSGPKPLEVEKCYMEPCSSERIGVDIKDDPYRSDSSIKVGGGSPSKSYSWKEQGYTHCSATCLGGVQELIVNCVRDDTQKVTSPYLCPIELKPETLMRTCNDHPCPPRWNYSEFSTCTQSCGMGIQTREVNCIHEVTQGGGNTVIVPNNMCPQPAPPDRQLCNMLDCPVRWKVSEWSRCSKTCGGGKKIRNIECLQVKAQNHTIDRPPSMCPQPKPAENKPCNTKSCIIESDKPQIEVYNSTHIQHDPKKKKISLKVGGAATVFLGTTIKIKCPVKRFNRTKIQWLKDKNPLPKNKKYKMSKKGALRVQNLIMRDSGLYTCVAGKSTASIQISVRPKPGEFPTSEEIQRQGYKNDRVDLISDHHINRGDSPMFNSDDHSHEQRPDSPKRKPTPRTRLFTPTLPSLRLDSSMNSLNAMQSSTISDDKQTFSNSRGHRMIAFPHDEEVEDKPFPLLPDDVENETENDDDGFGSMVVLGKGTPDNLKFEWVITEWSECSETCGGNGFQMRATKCVVKLHNTTQGVDNNLCDDAGLSHPDTIRRCGLDECPKWAISDWSPCEKSKCFGGNMAMQRRVVKCQQGENTTTDSIRCNQDEKPPHRQECHNEKCVGKWKVGSWSECTATCEMQGVKYRILQCVWYGTKKPAGTACKDLLRPSVMKICMGQPCNSASADCKDHSMFCPNVKAMNMCKIVRYQQQCCQTCKG